MSKFSILPCRATFTATSSHCRPPSPTPNCNLATCQMHAILMPMQVAQAIFDAGAEYGCFQLVNHGVSLDLIARMQQAQRDFFALPLEAKAQGGRSWGVPGCWDGYGAGQLDGWMAAQWR